MRRRQLIRTAGLLAFVPLAGCGAYYDPEEAADASNTLRSLGLAKRGDATVLVLGIEQEPKLERETCNYNPAIQLTQCSSDWVAVDIARITVRQGERQVRQFASGPYDGSDLTIEIPWESAEYVVTLTAEGGEKAEISVSVATVDGGDSLEIEEIWIDEEL